MDPRAVVVATDLGPSTAEALAQAHDQAVRRRAPLVVCHVPAPGARPRRSSVEVQVFRATGRIPSEYDLVLADGEPSAAITWVARRRRAGLVVLGGPRSGGLRRALLGGVAERVIRDADASVLVARASGRRPNVVAGTDFSDPALPALAAGAEEAARRGGTFAACHAIPFSAVTTATGPERAVVVPTLVEPLERGASRRLSAAVGAGATTRVELAEPSTLLLRAADDLEAGLVVVGTRRRGALRRMLFGSVAEQVVRRAPCSVLVVRLAAS